MQDAYMQQAKGIYVYLYATTTCIQSSIGEACRDFHPGEIVSQAYFGDAMSTIMLGKKAAGSRPKDREWNWETR